MISGFLPTWGQCYQQVPMYFFQQVQVVPPTPNLIPVELQFLPILRNQCQSQIPNQTRVAFQRRAENEAEVTESGDGRTSSRSQRLRKKHQKFEKRTNNSLKGKPERNALTNIGNQILTFVYLKKKNLETIQSCFPDLTSQQLRAYYTFAKEVKQSMYGYINYEKLASLWYPCEEETEDVLNTKILRTLSNYYVREILVQSILTSKKMPPAVKPMHLRVRRKLLYFIKTHKLKAD